MYPEIPILLSLTFILAGLVALAWSSDAFVDGAAALARRLGVSPFIIGMVVIGFGTCAPEFCVSVFSGISGHADISLGNAYGSCNFNVAAILGISALICPLVVKPTLTFVGAPFMTLVAFGSILLLAGNHLSRGEGLVLLGAFAILFPLYCLIDQRSSSKTSNVVAADLRAATKNEEPLPSRPKSDSARMLFNLTAGLVVMIAASHFLVWGSVDLARALGASELLIGLTIVAIGTSIPELATAIQSARKGESDLILGNIVGSNIFNMMVVVGTAGALAPTGSFSPYVVSRDLPVLIGVSLTIVLFGLNFRRTSDPGRINRVEGLLWILVWLGYTAFMLYQEL